MQEKENSENIDLINKNGGILSNTAAKARKQPIYIDLLANVIIFFHDLGKSVCEIITDLISGVLLFLGYVIGWFWVRTEKARIFLFGKIKYAGIFIFSPVLKFAASASRMRKEVRAANRENGMKSAIPTFFKLVFTVLFGKRGALVTTFNYIIPIISIIFLVNVVSYATNMDYAVRLEVNGRFVGYIENELVFTEAQKTFEQRLNYLGSTTMVTVSPQFTIEKVGYSEILNSNSVVNHLMETSGVVVEHAYGIIIRNQFKGAVTDNASLLEVREALLDVHRIGVPDEEVDFLWTVDFSQGGLYTTDSIIDPQTIIREITAISEEAQYYTVVAGDSQSLIADTLGMSTAMLERLNPGFSERELYVGDIILYSAEVPALPVTVTRTEVYEQEVDYPIEYRDDSSIFVGTTAIYNAGVSGSEMVTARVTLMNGVETGRSIISRQILTQPVTQIILHGSRPIPAGTEISNESAGYGNFIWPLPTTVSRIAQLHGSENPGYRTHSGIDIAAPYGTPVFAAEGGTIVHVGWSGGYGHCIIIEHPNGLRTLYSHMSSYVQGLYVGQQVIRGQSIAFVGATGSAYGNHLHFEVRHGSQILNPRSYLDARHFGR